MILATEHTTHIPPTPSSPMTAAKSIGCISMVPTAGESSPTSVLVDVTAETPGGISELKRIQGYSNDLLLPEAMVYGNDLIKVWNIEDEQTAGENSSYPKTATMTRLHQEEPTYNKAWLGLHESPTQKKPATPVLPSLEPPSPMEVDDESPLAEVDDLFLALPPTSISLPPRLSSPTPVSLPASPSIGGFTIGSSGSTSRSDSISTLGSGSTGSTNTIVLDKNGTDASLDDITKPTRTPMGHRRGHRRHCSHFDFQFT